jgi:hypothetical protein
MPPVFLLGMVKQEGLARCGFRVLEPPSLQNLGEKSLSSELPGLSYAVIAMQDKLRYGGKELYDMHPVPFHLGNTSSSSGW